MKNAKKENIVLLISQLLLIVVDVVCELPNAKFVSNLIDYERIYYGLNEN